ncbi:MAG TPA: sulfatase [Chryseosolibacter sp.]|nr:sulfatase [Chryseosolibacter sp.]
MQASLFLVLLLLFTACGKRLTGNERPDQPNVIVIFTDDQGYRDLSCYGSKDIETPNIDKLAREGVRFTNFYVGQPVCSASRAALLTGCYPSRVGIQGALFPNAKIGLNTREVTIAEICKSKGYRTAMVGKWHLGNEPEFLPTKQGFDKYLGVPYSNDMWPKHPDNQLHKFPRLPLIKNDSVIDYFDEDQNNLTTLYTNEAIRFIEASKDNPFFLYLAHNMPHVPLFVSEKFRGKSEAGLYGDVIMEIDWSVGTIMETLKKFDLDDNTLVIFTSDNGPWLSYGKHAGSAFPLREGKGTVFEGGVRVPCIMRWPGNIPPGIVQEKAAMSIDILPTIANLIDAPLPENKIDGKDIWPLMIGEPAARPSHDAFYFYFNQNELQGMRSGKWKLYFPHTYRSFEGRQGRNDGMPTNYEPVKVGLELYDLENDIGEKNNVADQYPAVVDSLQTRAASFRKKLGDSLTGVQGSEVRQPGRIGE